MSLVDLRNFPAAAKRTYLNSASVGLMYKPAEEAVTVWQRDIAENGTANFDDAAESRVFDELRGQFARLIGARPEDIAVGSSATELMASLAWAIAPGRGRNIVVVDIAFPSTVYPWARVCRHTGCALRWVTARGECVSQEEILAAIDADTAVVCLSHVEYGTGQRYDLGRIAEAAHARGALLVVDATQSAGAVPIDVGVECADALVTGSYKWLCGPFGVGLLYIAPRLQESLDPGIVGWRSHEQIYDLQATRLQYPAGAQRFEASTMAYGCAVGLTRSIAFVRQVGVECIWRHNCELADILIEALRSLGASITSPLSTAERTSIVCARLPGRDAKALVGQLGRCDIVVSARREGIRFSPHLYNGAADVSRTLAVLRDLHG
ncbi:MAG TPA: aminotransferase class V-fold PLP-dependent enzyme [Steroidobacteraceae bacterium]|nr:aminotransferase class V-fold PLP-dependent enzyme [Steroidobacteraceae bacterium]